MTQDKEYKAWWHNEGSGIFPLPNEDMEEFVHRMTQIAWSNGAFIEREACAEIAEKQRYAMYISLTSYPPQNGTAVGIANQIRARGQAEEKNT